MDPDTQAEFENAQNDVLEILLRLDSVDLLMPDAEPRADLHEV